MDNVNYSLAMKGMSIMSACIEPSEHQFVFVAAVLMGTHDEALGELTRLQANGNEAEGAARLERLKEVFRHEIQEIFRIAELQDELVKEKAKLEVLAELKQNQRPHELGTVAEISAKYGISKSEVRRRKADGTLHELVK